MQPDNHEGIDLVSATPQQVVRTIAPGSCLFAGTIDRPHCGLMAVFRHVRPDGAQVLSIYGHLSELRQIQTGLYYPESTPIGAIHSQAAYQPAYLHFALAFGASWEHGLNAFPAPPPNAGTSWIQDRYLDPTALIEEWNRGKQQPKRFKNARE